MSHAYYLLFVAALCVTLGVYLQINQDSLLSDVGIEEMDTMAPDFRVGWIIVGDLAIKQS